MGTGCSGPRKTESGRAGKDHDPFALQAHLDIFRLMKFCPHNNGERIDRPNCSSGLVLLASTSLPIVVASER